MDLGIGPGTMMRWNGTFACGHMKEQIDPPDYSLPLEAKAGALLGRLGDGVRELLGGLVRI